MKKLIEIVLCGSSGRMGKEVSDTVSKRNNFVVVAGVDKVINECRCYETYDIISKIEHSADVLIDFSSSGCLEEILDYGVMKSMPLVLCTTGYSEKQIEDIRLASNKIPIFYSRNMSLGVNVLLEISKLAAKILKKCADVCIVEKHHIYKKDAPSGTALMIAEGVRSVIDCEIDIHSVRAGSIVGDHEVIFAGKDEVLTLSHSAASKEIFANGALNAAAFIIEQEKGLYNMEDLVRTLCD